MPIDALEDIDTRELLADQRGGGGGGGTLPIPPSYLDPGADETEESRDDIDELSDTSLPEEPRRIGASV